MRIAPNRLYSLIAFLFTVMTSFAGNGNGGPPSPTGKRPPGPPGLPIDENLHILLTIALLYGIFILYKHRLKTKL